MRTTITTHHGHPKTMMRCVTGAFIMMLASVVSVTVLAKNPKVTAVWSTPANGAVFTYPATIALTVDAQDRQQNHPLVQVDFVVNAAPLATVTTASGTLYSFNWINAVPGQYTLTATGTNDKGDTGTTDPITVTINKGNQAITGFNPTTPLTYAPNTTFTLSATGGASNNAVVFVSTAPAICSVTANMATILAAGTCTVTADQAGDVNYNAAPQVTATVINTAPVIALTSPTGQTSLTAPANLTLTATATEAGGTIAQVEFYYGTTKIATVATGSSGNNGTAYTASWTNVSAGSYILTAKAIDASGGIKTSTPLTVTVNAVAAQAQVYYIHADHLGTPRAITTSDAANVKVWEWKNDDPFGTNQPNQDPNATGTAFQYNLRFPGQYYDMETNTHYNYFRDYDPSIGRYVQSDPIGLKGGNNTYAYADGSPTSRSDLLGLATQMCTAPLHALTKSFGKSVSGFAHDKIPMAHHQYVCVSDGKGGWICGGQDQRGKKWYDPIHGPGTKSDDSYNQEMCKEKEPDDKELEQCLIRKFDGARPNYGIPFGTDCQEWAEKIIEECKSDVKRARDTRRRAG